MRPYHRFKKNHRILHLLVISTALVMAWWGTWGLLDTYLLPENRVVGYLMSIGVSFFILYLDGFHLRELE